MGGLQLYQALREESAWVQPVPTPAFPLFPLFPAHLSVNGNLEHIFHTSKKHEDHLKTLQKELGSMI